MKWYILALKKYGQFRGRSQAKEFWYFIFINLILGFVIVGIENKIGLNNSEEYDSFFIGLFIFVAIIPCLAVTVRRLHDSGESGWMILVNLIPILGPIWLLILVLKSGDVGENRFGAAPNTMSAFENSTRDSDYL